MELAPSQAAATPSSAEYVVTGIKRHGRKAGLALAGIAMVVAAGLYFWLRERPLDSLAVLPFVKVGADPNTEYLSDGISESIINNLSQLPKLSVRSFSSVLRYRSRDVTPAAAGKELKVQAVLTGRLSDYYARLAMTSAGAGFTMTAGDVHALNAPAACLSAAFSFGDR